MAISTELGADGFVSALSNPLPELTVAIWDAARADDAERAFRLQSQFTRLARATGFGPMHACLEAMCRHRGLLDRMLPPPLRSLDPEAARRVEWPTSSTSSGSCPGRLGRRARTCDAPGFPDSGGDRRAEFC